jgi:hypothetical protein
MQTLKKLDLVYNLIGEQGKRILSNALQDDMNRVILEGTF